MELQYIGLDNGNGYMKAKSEEMEVSYENRLIELSGCEFSPISVSDTRYSYKGDTFVLSSSGISSGGRDSSRYLTDQYLIEVLIGITHVIKRTNVVLTVGVPCRDYLNHVLRDKIAKRLKGEHTIMVNDRVMQINIVAVLVCCEPLGSLVDMLYSDQLTATPKSMSYRYATIDIGYGTTDILCTVDGIRAEKVASADVGCIDITNQYLSLINKRFTGTDKRFTVEDVGLHLPQKVEKYEVLWDFSDELMKAKRYVARKLQASVNQAGVNLSDYDRVLYTGGGAVSLYDYLQLTSNARVNPVAQMGNARGYEKFGKLIKGM